MNHDESLFQLELIKTKIQVNNDSAQTLLLYGTIPLGIIVFLLPILNVTSAPWLYWFGLLSGTILLAYGSFAIISFAREQMAWSDRAYGQALTKFLNKKNSKDSFLINEFSQHPPQFEREGLLFRSAKYTTIVGLSIYGLLFLFGMLQSLSTGNSFF